MNRDELDSLLEAMHPLLSPALVAGGWIADFQGALYDAEKAVVAASVDKRLREFTAGRTAARTVLAKAGLPRCVIPSGQHGEPVWPTGFTGSITHSNELCFAACGKLSQVRSIGIDTERKGRMRRELWRMVFSADEQASLETAPDTDLYSTVAFSAKEAFQKAQFALSGKIMESADMRVEFDKSATGVFLLRYTASDMSFAAVPALTQGHWVASGDHVFAGCLIV